MKSTIYGFLIITSVIGLEVYAGEGPKRPQSSSPSLTASHKGEAFKANCPDVLTEEQLESLKQGRIQLNGLHFMLDTPDNSSSKDTSKSQQDFNKMLDHSSINKKLSVAKIAVARTDKGRAFVTDIKAGKILKCTYTFRTFTQSLRKDEHTTFAIFTSAETDAIKGPNQK